MTFKLYMYIFYKVKVWTHLHDDIDVGWAVHTVVHGHQICMVKGRQLAKDLYLLYENLWSFLYSFFSYHFHSHGLWRILKRNKDVRGDSLTSVFLKVILFRVSFFVELNGINWMQHLWIILCSKLKINKVFVNYFSISGIPIFGNHYKAH